MYRTHRPTPPARAGGVSPKGCLIAVLAVIAVIVGVFACAAFLAHNFLSGKTSVAIEMPAIADPEKVRQALDQKLDGVQPPAVPDQGRGGTSPGAPADSSITLSSDELNLLLRQVLPPELAESVHVTIQNGEATVLAPVKGALVAQLLPPEFTTLRSYVGGLKYVNLHVRAKIRYANEKWEVEVKEVKQPFEVSPQIAQKTVAELMIGRDTKDLKITLGKGQFTLVGLELKDNSAVVTVGAPRHQ